MLIDANVGAGDVGFVSAVSSNGESAVAVRDAAVQSGSQASSERERFRMALDDSPTNPRSAVRVRNHEPGHNDDVGDPGTGGGDTGEDVNILLQFSQAVMAVGLMIGGKAVMNTFAVGQAMMAKHRAQSDEAKEEANRRLMKAFAKPLL